MAVGQILVRTLLVTGCFPFSGWRVARGREKEDAGRSEKGAQPQANSSLQHFSNKSDPKLHVVQIKPVPCVSHTDTPFQHGVIELSQTGHVLVMLVCWEEPSGGQYTKTETKQSVKLMQRSNGFSITVKSRKPPSKSSEFLL